MNKCLTILVNVMIWDNHATPGGIASLLLCIGGGIIYQQAPMRGAKSPSPVTADDDEFKSDVSITAHMQDEDLELSEKGTSSSTAKRRG